MKKLNIAALAFSGVVFLNSCRTAKQAAEKPEVTVDLVRAEPVF